MTESRKSGRPDQMKSQSKQENRTDNPTRKLGRSDQMFILEKRETKSMRLENAEMKSTEERPATEIGETVRGGTKQTLEIAGVREERR